MALFQRPLKKLETDLFAGWHSLHLPGRTSIEDRLNISLNAIINSARAAIAAGKRTEALAAIERARRPEVDDPIADVWRRLLDMAVEHL